MLRENWRSWLKEKRPSAVWPSNANRLMVMSAMVTALILIALTVASAQSNQAAKFTEDLPPGSMQAKAVASCQECHEARIIVQQRLSKAAWTKEVDKMIKWGAVVDASDHDALIDYLTEVVKHYRDTFAITFRTLEPLNEPNASWWTANGSQEGCHFSP